jgi:AcrR family transcriptional regulator
VVVEVQEPVDGRRARGDASRRAILDAASTVIRRDGVAALTHRAVAESAEVSLARVAYHFGTIDDLLVAAATQYLADFDDRLQAVAAVALAGRRSVVEACTDFLLDLVTERSDEFLAMVEVRLALHRLGHHVDGAELLGVVGSFGADDRRAAGIVASLFGFAVLASMSPAPPPRADVKVYVRSILEQP